jgi:hypothetical protein
VERRAWSLENPRQDPLIPGYHIRATQHSKEEWRNLENGRQVEMFAPCLMHPRGSLM